MKHYVKPTINIELIEEDVFLMTSFSVKEEDKERHNNPTQCDCFNFRFWGGCLGCTGHCGCNHWDSELGRIVPGC